MADETKKTVEVPVDLLKEMQEKIAALEARDTVNAVMEGKKDIRELESLEAKFKQKKIRLRKVRILNDKNEDKGGIVIGWTARGAYEVVDKSGPNAVNVNMMDVFFLGGPKDKPTTITLKTLMSGEEIWCDEVSRDVQIKKHKTGEEIEVMEWDTKTGRGNNQISTGVIIDGYYAIPEGTMALKVPGQEEPVIIDIRFANA